MRLWSLHPGLLDSKGLVACWREALLAKAVLAGRTTGYKHHPQLERFRAHPRPIAAIDTYLDALWREAERRGYRFARSKIGRSRTRSRIPVTTGQVAYELAWLKNKLRARDRAWLRSIVRVRSTSAHPLFVIRPGGIAEWERRPETG